MMLKKKVAACGALNRVAIRDLTPEEHREYFKYLNDAFLYGIARDLGDGTYLVAYRLLFHWSLARGVIGDKTSITERWCYPNEMCARIALWCYRIGEVPRGWHKRTDTQEWKEKPQAFMECLAWADERHREAYSEKGKTA